MHQSNASAASFFWLSVTDRYRCKTSRLECPEIDWITRRGTPFELAAVNAERRKECVETPSKPNLLQASRSEWSTVRLGKCFVLSRAEGNSQSALEGSIVKDDRQAAISCQSFGCMGMVRVPIFFLVHALGITTA